jgi:hypothetical protein
MGIITLEEQAVEARREADARRLEKPVSELAREIRDEWDASDRRRLAQLRAETR